MKAVATTGTVWGQWTVLARADRGRVKARCSCGIEKTILASNLTRGVSKSCGCRTAKAQKKKYFIGIGQRFSKWVVVGVPDVGQWVEVRCDCGKESRRRCIDLINEKSKSCGCGWKENYLSSFKAKDARVAREERLLAEVLTPEEQAQVDRIVESRRKFSLNGQEIKLEAIEVVVSDRGLGWLLCHGGLEEIC